MTELSEKVAHNKRAHVPVMLTEVLHALNPKAGEVYVDGTFGAGGYTRAILESCDCIVYAVDRDPDAFETALKMAEEFNGRLKPLKGCFGDVESLLKAEGISKIKGFVLDVGVSSMQLDQPARGFSFMQDGPLDMRMSQMGQSAKDVVNETSEEKLANIIFEYGDEKSSRRIAKEVLLARKEKPIETTGELKKIIHKVLPMHGGIKTDTATKTFQALRIFVNDELGELNRALKAAERILAEDGRLVVVSFHSLEDGCVKTFLREKAEKKAVLSRLLPWEVAETTKATFIVEAPSGIAPTQAEVKSNPRARSARLRCAVRNGEGADA